MPAGGPASLSMTTPGMNTAEKMAVFAMSYGLFTRQSQPACPLDARRQMAVLGEGVTGTGREKLQTCGLRAAPGGDAEPRIRHPVRGLRRSREFTDQPVKP